MASMYALFRTIAIISSLVSLEMASTFTPTVTTVYTTTSLAPLMMPTMTTLYTTTSLATLTTTADPFADPQNTVFTRPSTLHTALCDDCPYAGMPEITPDGEESLASATLTSAMPTIRPLPSPTGNWISGPIDPNGPWYRHHWVLTATLALLLYIAGSTLLLLLLLTWRMMDLRRNARHFSCPGFVLLLT